ncbi:MAG: hypothetical protein IPP14_15625 [Planctomycetes bacterium]|nr:hypothetical protein [Planctomycetota bacterium]
MTDILKTLGISAEELTKRVVDQCCEKLLVTYHLDGDGDEYAAGSPLAKALDKRIKTEIDKAINGLAERLLGPKIETLVETIKLQKTNQWGEKNGGAVTFIEYLAQRADAYLQENVTSDGKEPRDSYDRHNLRPRIVHMIDQHLHYRIQEAAQGAMKPIMEAMSKGMTDVAKAEFDKASKSLKICIEAKR